MEDLIRVCLLGIGAVIIFLILGYRRRQNKINKGMINREASGVTDPDTILGLEPREPVMSSMNVESNVVTAAAEESSIVASESVSPNKIAINTDLIPPLVSPPILEKEKIKSPEADLTKDLLALSVVARFGGQFASYDLFQAIAVAGMQFGDMNIFHYYETIPGEKVTLFSLASSSEPGDFDLNRMGDFSCSGLTLFTNLREVPNPKAAFDSMLNAAMQLAEDLDGELRVNKRVPWNNTVLQQYQQKVERYQAMSRTISL